MAGSALPEWFDADEDREPILVRGQLLDRRQVDEVVAVLGVRRIEQARDLHLVLQVAHVDVDALGASRGG